MLVGSAMRHRPCLLFLAALLPALGAAQTLSVYDAAYRLEADARSGPASDSQLAFNNGLGPVQSFYDRIDAYANNLPSYAHSWASVDWLCTPTSLDLELVACWDSLDLGAGNSGHMMSQLFLGLDLDFPNFVTIAAVFDQPNSFVEVDRWNGFAWTLFIHRSQIGSFAGVWNPAFYRLRAQRLYNPVGDSTGCQPFEFHLAAEAVPEPASLLALGAGAALALRRRRR